MQHINIKLVVKMFSITYFISNFRRAKEKRIYYNVLFVSRITNMG